MDEHNALRIQDRVERKFRNREREAMRKKKDDDASMKKARDEQVSACCYTGIPVLHVLYKYE
jgi:hypothetical protein